MGKLLPVLALLIGAAGGGGAAHFLAVPEADCADADCEVAAPEPVEADYVKLSNQFIVPVVRDERVRSLVVLSLSLEISPESRDSVFAAEPKIRDSFLQVMFEHAHAGAFDGPFTETGRLELLRSGLRDAARSVLSEAVHDVLITDIVRQEVG